MPEVIVARYGRQRTAYLQIPVPRQRPYNLAELGQCPDGSWEIYYGQTPQRMRRKPNSYATPEAAIDDALYFALDRAEAAVSAAEAKRSVILRALAERTNAGS